MKYASIATLLVEEATPQKIGQKESVFVNRMIMRFFSVPAALSALADVGIIKEEGDGPTTIQLDFQRLPEDVIPQIINLIAPPGKMTMTKYVKNGQARNGFEFELHPNDLKGDDYDYASS
jgi:hypothetical protein